MNRERKSKNYFAALFDDWAGRISTALTLLTLVLSVLPTRSMTWFYDVVPQQVFFVACFAFFGYVNYRLYTRMAVRIAESQRESQTQRDLQRMAEAQEASNRLRSVQTKLLADDLEERRRASLRTAGLMFRLHSHSWHVWQRDGTAEVTLVNEGKNVRDLTVLAGTSDVSLGTQAVKTGKRLKLNLYAEQPNAQPLVIDLDYRDSSNRQRQHRLTLFPNEDRLEQADVTEHRGKGTSVYW